MASRTSAAALSTFELGLKTARIRVFPSSLFELTSFTPLTRATAPSRIRVTSASMVSGEAPGKFARTFTTGSSTSGSSRTSIANMATRPAMAISRFITVTNQGRFTPSEGSPAPARLFKVVFTRESQRKWVGVGGRLKILDGWMQHRRLWALPKFELQIGRLSSSLAAHSGFPQG